MKTFKIYKNIRKRAMIMGLPISLFALMMTVVIGSLLFIIFSFGFSVIIVVFLFNGALYIALSHLTKNPSVLHLRKVFPQTISNKKQSHLYYEDH
jgi:type IV secretory pathway VirB3-like protein